MTDGQRPMGNASIFSIPSIKVGTELPLILLRTSTTTNGQAYYSKPTHRQIISLQCINKCLTQIDIIEIKWKRNQENLRTGNKKPDLDTKNQEKT